MNNNFDWKVWYNKYRMIIVGLFIHFVLYLVVSFIVMDLNPTNWIIFNSKAGRFIFIVFEIFLIGWIFDDDDNEYDYF